MAKLKYYLQEGNRLQYVKDFPAWTGSFDSMFKDLDRKKYERCRSIRDADIVVWSGGPDVTPALYGHTARPETRFHVDRDFNDMLAYRFSGKARLRLGICRGAQFLNVMSGGELYQHHTGPQDNPNGHAGQSHEVVRYKIKHMNDPSLFDIEDSFQYTVTSTHHQIMKPSKKGIVLGVGIKDDWSSMSLCRSKSLGGNFENYSHAGSTYIIPVEAFEEEHHDVEMVWYPHTRSLCIQGHPEYDNASDEFIEDTGRMIQEALACAD